MAEHTNEDEYRAETWLNNALCSDDTVAAICRIADATPGVEEWAVLMAIIGVWDGLDADGKLHWLGIIAAPAAGLKDGLLLGDPAPSGKAVDRG
jgi:hypothetical protein